MLDPGEAAGLRPIRNSHQNSNNSLSPTAVPRTSWVPSIETPVATTISGETRGADADFAEGGIEEYVGKAGVGQGAFAEACDFAIEWPADP